MMGPIAAVESVIFGYFKFSGRASRAEYWWWGLIQFAGLALCLTGDIIKLTGVETPPLNPIEYLSFVFVLLTVAPNLSVTIRRLHDTGRSGLWYFILLVPFIGGIWFLILMVLPSEKDDNIYGPPWRNDKSWKGKSTGKRDPMQAYAILDRLHEEPTEEVRAARKQEIREYYKTRVLQT